MQMRPLALQNKGDVFSFGFACYISFSSSVKYLPTWFWREPRPRAGWSTSARFLKSVVRVSGAVLCVRGVITGLMYLPVWCVPHFRAGWSTCARILRSSAWLGVKGLCVGGMFRSSGSPCDCLRCCSGEPGVRLPCCLCLLRACCPSLSLAQSGYFCTWSA